MLRTWSTVIVILGLIISALFYSHTVYKKGYIAGQNAEKVQSLEQDNKDLAEQLKGTITNIEEANRFDEDNRVRTIDNEHVIVPRNLIPNADGAADLDEQFLSELAKLR